MFSRARHVTLYAVFLHRCTKFSTCVCMHSDNVLLTSSMSLFSCLVQSGTSSSSDQSKPTTSSRIKSIRLAPPTASGPTDNGKSAFEVISIVK